MVTDELKKRVVCLKEDEREDDAVLESVRWNQRQAVDCCLDAKGR